MPSNKRRHSSGDVKAPPAKREKFTNIIDLSEDNKENLPAEQTNKLDNTPLNPLQEVIPWSAAAQTYKHKTDQRYGLSSVANALRPSKTVSDPSDPDFMLQSKVEEEEKVDRIRAAMTARPGTLFVVEAEQDDEYEGRVGGCIAIHKTLDGALGGALNYLDDYGMTDAVIGEMIDDDDDEQSQEEVYNSDDADNEDSDEDDAIHKQTDDVSEQWKRINALLDVAELSGEGEKPTLRIMEEDDESTTFTITIEMMKVGA